MRLQQSKKTTAGSRHRLRGHRPFPNLGFAHYLRLPWLELECLCYHLITLVPLSDSCGRHLTAYPALLYLPTYIAGTCLGNQRHPDPGDFPARWAGRCSVPALLEARLHTFSRRRIRSATKPRLAYYLLLTLRHFVRLSSSLSFFFSFFPPSLLRLPTMSSPGPPVQTLLGQTVSILGTAVSWARLPAIASTVRQTASLTVATP